MTGSLIKSSSPSITKGQGLSHHALGKLTQKRVLSIKFWEAADEFLPVNAEPYKALRLTGRNFEQSNVRRELRIRRPLKGEPSSSGSVSTGRSLRLALGAYIVSPRYHHRDTHDFSGTAMQQHDALLQKRLSEDLDTYKAEFRSYKEKTDIFQD